MSAIIGSYWILWSCDWLTARVAFFVIIVSFVVRFVLSWFFLTEFILVYTQFYISWSFYVLYLNCCLSWSCSCLLLCCNTIYLLSAVRIVLLDDMLSFSLLFYVYLALAFWYFGWVEPSAMLIYWLIMMIFLSKFFYFLPLKQTHWVFSILMRLPPNLVKTIFPSC